MNSIPFSIVKKLLVLTLLAGLLFVPTFRVLAEEQTVEVVESVVSETVIEETLVEEVVTIEISEEVEEVNSEVEVEIETVGVEAVEEVRHDFGGEKNLTPEPTAGFLLDEDTLAVSDELGDETVDLPAQTEDESSDVEENNFTTDPADDPVDNPADTLTVSGENNFDTSSTSSVPGPTDTLTMSGENDFTTTTGGGGGSGPGPSPIDTLTISGENDFTTTTGGGDGGPGPTDTLTISGENDFTTTTSTTFDTLTISGENDFTTTTGGGGGPGPGPDDMLTISDENDFTTATDDTLSISDELSFNTTSGGGGGGGSTGSGGSSGGSGQIITTETFRCELYLKDYIRFGRANDTFEVIKLQVFLRVFEGFTNLPITGVYDRETFRAVEIFQQRYQRDILTPWGIADPTGYVYITTRLAINHIYCGQDTANDLDLRYRFEQEYRRAIIDLDLELPAELEDEGYTISPTSTATTTTSVVKEKLLPAGRQVLLAGLFNLIDFINDNFCWLLNLLLLLIILFLLWLLWLATKDEKERPNNPVSTFRDSSFVGAVPLSEALTREDEEVLAELAEEEESVLPAANNNPDQEAIPLGPEDRSVKGE